MTRFYENKYRKQNWERDYDNDTNICFESVLGDCDIINVINKFGYIFLVEFGQNRVPKSFLLLPKGNANRPTCRILYIQNCLARLG